MPKRVKLKMPKGTRESSSSSRELKVTERAFVREYVVLLNGSAAYIAAGLGTTECAPSTTRSKASRLLKNPRIAAAIEHEFELQAAHNNITKERLTGMLLEARERAIGRRNSNAEVAIITQLGKLHGFFAEKHQHVHLRISEMNEEQLREFLGDNYDPSLTEKLGRVIDGDVPALPAPASDEQDIQN